MEQRIPGRNGTTSVISDGSVAGRSVSIGGPDPVDHPERWHPKDFTGDELARRYGVDADDIFDWETRFGFPRGEARQHSRFGVWRVRISRHYPQERVLAWEADIRTLVKRLPKR
jgi:hypothetical protein